jgi:hypothetical protein
VRENVKNFFTYAGLKRLGFGRNLSAIFIQRCISSEMQRFCLKMDVASHFSSNSAEYAKILP